MLTRRVFHRPLPLALAALTTIAALAAPRQDSKPTPVPSATLLAAAFGEFAKAGRAYADLHRRHLGVTQPAPESSSCAAWPPVIVGPVTIRIAFVVEVPLHTVDASGRYAGFEADLAGELIRRINACYPSARVTLDWVRVNVTLPVGPAKNFTQFNVLAAGLRARRYDVAFSSIVPVSAPDITYLVRRWPCSRGCSRRAGTSSTSRVFTIARRSSRFSPGIPGSRSCTG